MLFIEPVWLSILIPIFFALILLGASIVVRHLGGPGFDKAPVLAVAALALAASAGGLLFAALLLALTLFTHWIGLTIERAGARRSGSSGGLSGRAWLIVAIAVQVASVAALSRAPAAGDEIRTLRTTLVPFGVSYFAFHAISYVVDVYRRRASAERSRWQLGVHLVLLPQIVAAPIAYESIARQLARHLPSVSDYSYGVRRLIIGVWKVFVMAALTGAQADRVFAQRPGGLPAFQAWLGLFCFALQIYYAFSGYADMGIGLGRMFGIRLPEHFRWPYVGGSVREFWRRWHIGLSTWFRDYVDVRLDPDRVPPPSAAREALVVVACAVWYGAGWTFLAWGLYHAALVAIERAGLEAWLKKVPKPVAHVYLIASLMAGFVVLRSRTPADALLFFRALAGLNIPIVSARPAIGVDLWLLLAAGAIGCAPLFSTIRRWTVAIDALIVSLLMMLFASILFALRGVRIVAVPALKLWRPTMRVGRRGGSAF